jgi:hypothetical protein
MEPADYRTVLITIESSYRAASLDTYETAHAAPQLAANQAAEL